MNDSELHSIVDGTNIQPSATPPTKKKMARMSDDEHNYNSLRARFWMQAVMTGTITSFCITMIAIHGQEGIYLPILTGLLGYWLPAPDSSIKRSSK